MVAAITYEVAEEELFAQAVVLLINTDLAKFAVYYGGRVRWCRPTIDDSMIQNPDCIVQAGVQGSPFSRQIGSYAKMTHSVTITLWEDPAAEPYLAADANKPERLINHLEKLLEYGSMELALPTDPAAPGYAAALAAALASRSGKGWLVDPTSVSGDPPMTRYLNLKPPAITRLQPQLRMDRENEHVVSTVYPLIVTWEAFVDRLTRRRS